MADAEWVRRTAAPSDISVPPWFGDLDVGERAALTLAIPVRVPILIDDLAGRRGAARVGVPVIGAVGVLLLAKRRGRIDHVRPKLDALVHGGLRLSTRLYRDILARAGEGARRDEPNVPGRSQG